MQRIRSNVFIVCRFRLVLGDILIFMFLQLYHFVGLYHATQGDGGELTPVVQVTDREGYCLT